MDNSASNIEKSEKNVMPSELDGIIYEMRQRLNNQKITTNTYSLNLFNNAVELMNNDNLPPRNTDNIDIILKFMNSCERELKNDKLKTMNNIEKCIFTSKCAKLFCVCVKLAMKLPKNNIRETLMSCAETVSMYVKSLILEEEIQKDLIQSFNAVDSLEFKQAVCNYISMRCYSTKESLMFKEIFFPLANQKRVSVLSLKTISDELVQYQDKKTEVTQDYLEEIMRIYHTIEISNNLRDQDYNKHEIIKIYKNLYCSYVYFALLCLIDCGNIVTIDKLDNTLPSRIIRKAGDNLELILRKVRYHDIELSQLGKAELQFIVKLDSILFNMAIHHNVRTFIDTYDINDIHDMDDINCELDNYDNRSKLNNHQSQELSLQRDQMFGIMLSLMKMVVLKYQQIPNKKTNNEIERYELEQREAERLERGMYREQRHNIVESETKKFLKNMRGFVEYSCGNNKITFDDVKTVISKHLENLKGIYNEMKNFNKYDKDKIIEIYINLYCAHAYLAICNAIVNSGVAMGNECSALLLNVVKMAQTHYESVLVLNSPSTLINNDELKYVENLETMLNFVKGYVKNNEYAISIEIGSVKLRNDSISHELSKEQSWFKNNLDDIRRFANQQYEQIQERERQRLGFYDAVQPSYQSVLTEQIQTYNVGKKNL